MTAGTAGCPLVAVPFKRHWLVFGAGRATDGTPVPVNGTCVRGLPSLVPMSHASVADPAATGVKVTGTDRVSCGAIAVPSDRALGEAWNAAVVGAFEITTLYALLPSFPIVKLPGRRPPTSVSA